MNWLLSYCPDLYFGTACLSPYSRYNHFRHLAVGCIFLKFLVRGWSFCFITNISFLHHSPKWWMTISATCIHFSSSSTHLMFFVFFYCADSLTTTFIVQADQKISGDDLVFLFSHFFYSFFSFCPFHFVLFILSFSFFPFPSFIEDYFVISKMESNA